MPTPTAPALPGRALARASRHARRLSEVTDWRHRHYLNRDDDDTNPAMDGPIAHVRYQTPKLWVVGQELKQKLTSNHARVRATPKGEDKQTLADKAEATFYSLIVANEERLGHQIQEALSDGQIVDGHVWLHWWHNTHQWSLVERKCCDEYELDDEGLYEDNPDYDENHDSLSSTYARIKGQRPSEGKGPKRYREKAEYYEERKRAARAKDGCPYYIEVLPGTQVFADEDAIGGLKRIFVVRELSYGVWQAGLDDDDLSKHGDELIDRLKSKGTGILSGGVPERNSPSRSDWEPEIVTVCTVWTAPTRGKCGEWHEYVSLDAVQLGDGTDIQADDWEHVKGGIHGFPGVPFARIHAYTFLMAKDPVDRYRPALDGMFRLKESHDRFVALLMGLAELTALPELFMVMTDQKVPSLNADGTPVLLGRDSLSAYRLPPGYDIKSIDREVGMGIVQAVMNQSQELADAAPATGRVEIQASTQPWTARQWQAQEGVGPAVLIGIQARALRTMLRSIVGHLTTPAEMGGLAEDGLVLYSRDEGGNELDEIVGVTAKDLEGLTLDIDVSAVTEAERITLVRVGMELLQAGLITFKMFVEDYMLVPDASAHILAVLADRVYTQHLEPGLIAKTTGEIFGARVVMGVDGQAVGMGGQVVQPPDVLMRNGYKPQRPAGPPVGMPQLADQAPPAETGVIPQPAMG